MAWDQLVAPGLLVNESPVETARFGRSIARVSIGSGALDVDDLLREIDRVEADVVFVRYDASQIALGGVLARSSWTLIPAGTLVYWDKAAAAEPTMYDAGPTVEVIAAEAIASEDLSQVVRSVVAASFADYTNHYAANPLLDRGAALEGYKDWAVRSLSSPRGVVLVMTLQDEPIGVATLEESATGEHLEVLLAGLVPSAQGRHLYGALLSGCERAALRRGASRLVISTQSHNVRVQRAWARHGLRPIGAIETVHLVRPGLLHADR
jgi:RimJ/RimL family protein N-acetyltransferase